MKEIKETIIGCFFMLFGIMIPPLYLFNIIAIIISVLFLTSGIYTIFFKKEKEE